MDQNNIDQIFKTVLYDHKTSLDKDQLWAAIENRKKKRHFGFILFSTMLLVAVSFTGWHLWSSNTTSQLVSVKSADTSERKKDTPVISTTTVPLEAVDPADDRENAEKGNINKMNDKDLSSLNHIETQAPITMTSSTVKTRQIDKNKNKISIITIEKKATSRNATLYNHSERSIRKTTSNSKTISDGIRNVSQDKLSTNSGTISAGNTSSIAQLPIINNTQLFPASVAPKLFKSDVECYDHRKKVDPIYLEMYSTVDYVHNNFNASNDNLNYMKERDASQTQFEGYRAGLSLKYLTRLGLYAKGGVEVGIIKERFNREETTTRVELQRQEIERIISGDSLIIITGNVPVTIVDRTTYKIWNTYRTVGITMALGYQKQFKKLTYGLEVGGVYDLNYKFKGTLLDQNLEPKEVRNYFRSSRLSSLTGGISIGYGLSDRFTLIGRCSFKHNLGTINADSNPVEQTNSRIGLGIGLEVKL